LGFTDEKNGSELADALHFMNSFPEPTVIRIPFLFDLGAGIWVVSWYGKHKVVVFEKDCYKAIIMPCVSYFYEGAKE